jgi:iron complex transport system ATP-binding protein
MLYNKTIFKQGEKKEILNSDNLSKIFESKIILEEENQRYYIKSIE